VSRSNVQALSLMISKERKQPSRAIPKIPRIATKKKGWKPLPQEGGKAGLWLGKTTQIVQHLAALKWGKPHDKIRRLAVAASTDTHILSD